MGHDLQPTAILTKHLQEISQDERGFEQRVAKDIVERFRDKLPQATATTNVYRQIMNWKAGKKVPESFNRLVYLAQVVACSTDHLLGLTDIAKPQVQSISRLKMYDNLLLLSPDLKNLLLTSQPKTLRVIVSTGRDTVYSFLSELLTKTEVKNLSIHLRLIDSNFIEFSGIPEIASWKHEVEYTIEQLNVWKDEEKLKGLNISIKYRTYNYMPTIHGYLVREGDKDKHLFIGYYLWSHTVKKHGRIGRVEGAPCPFLYFEYNKNILETQYHFDLFNNWFEHGWEDEE